MIFIASPCGYVINRNFIECREDAVLWLQNMGYQVVTKLFQSVNIGMNRNEAMLEAHHNKAEWLIFIDTDMEFGGNDILELIRNGGSVVTGVCKTSERSYALYDYADSSSVITPIKELKLIVDICGGAFLAIRKNVIETLLQSLNRKWKSTKVGEVMMDYPFNLVTFPNHVQAGEDTSFCLRLKELGIKIHVAQEAIIGHEKIVCIK
jgi:hypothetical protein